MDEVMGHTLNRRRFLAGAGGSLAIAATVRSEEPGAEGGFSFPLLGDLHLDRLEHHDMEWLRREKPNDVRQVENYSRLTREIVPGLFEEVRGQIAAAGKVPFALHVGDFVEGLCGDAERARVHCRDGLALLREARLGAPFLFCKGNHDITGPGAPEAFDQVLLPFLAEQAKQELTAASYAVEHGNALFAFYDAYSPKSLEWLEKTLEKRRSGHVFVLIHPPVVPFGARSTWHVFAEARRQAERARLLSVLGRNRAIVLCGHLHKCGVVVRKTEEGAFLQLMVSSILSRPEAAAREVTAGVERYGPDLVRLEPQFQPETEALRRSTLRAEAPFIRHFEYADAPGYGVVDVRGKEVKARLYTGLGRRLWKEIDLGGLLSA